MGSLVIGIWSLSPPCCCVAGALLRSGETKQRWQQLADMVAWQIALDLANLSVREQLHQQAIHAPRTGVHNRRYLDETLPREL